MHIQGPVQRGAAAVLTLRWESVSRSGRPFPALDADITLVPEGEHAVLITLTGVCRQAPGTRPGQSATQTVAAAAIRTLLTHIAGVVSHPAGTADNSGTAVPPGRRSWVSPATN